MRKRLLQLWVGDEWCDMNPWYNLSHIHSPNCSHTTYEIASFPGKPVFQHIGLYWFLKQGIYWFSRYPSVCICFFSDFHLNLLGCWRFHGLKTVSVGCFRHGFLRLQEKLTIDLPPGLAPKMTKAPDSSPSRVFFVRDERTCFPKALGRTWFVRLDPWSSM